MASQEIDENSLVYSFLLKKSPKCAELFSKTNKVKRLPPGSPGLEDLIQNALSNQGSSKLQLSNKGTPARKIAQDSSSDSSSESDENSAKQNASLKGGTPKTPINIKKKKSSSSDSSSDAKKKPTIPLPIKKAVATTKKESSSDSSDSEDEKSTKVVSALSKTTPALKQNPKVSKKESSSSDSDSEDEPPKATKINYCTHNNSSLKLIHVTNDDVDQAGINKYTLKNIGATTFNEISENGYFIDKTLFIKDFLTSSDQITLITCPRRWGKSVNMSMLHQFLTIHVNNYGQIKEYDISRSNNYKVFSGPNYLNSSKKMNILNHQDIINKYMGKYPVIYLDFRNIICETYERQIESCILLLKQAFRVHEYLLHSHELTENQKEDFQKYSSVKFDKNNIDQYLSLIDSGLCILAGLLVKHFKVKVFVLIDEYDTPTNELSLEMIKLADIKAHIAEIMCKRLEDITKKDVNTNILDSILQIKQVRLEKASKLIASFMESILKPKIGEESYLEKALITGIFRIAKAGFFSGLNNVTEYNFLNNKFFKFYGFTKEDIKSLHNCLCDSTLEKIMKYYGGYIIHKEHFCNPWGIVQFISHNCEFGAYGDISSNFSLIENFFKHKEIKAKLLQLVGGTPISYNTAKDLTFDLLHFIKLSACINNDKYSINIPPQYIDIIFPFLIATGYISKKSNNQIVLSNQKSRKLFCEKILHIYRDEEKINFTTSSKVQEALLLFFQKNNNEQLEQELDQFLLDIHHALYNESLIQGIFTCMSLSLLRNDDISWCAINPRYTTTENKIPDIVIAKDKKALIIELKYNKQAYNMHNTTLLDQAYAQALKYDDFFSKDYIINDRKCMLVYVFQDKTIVKSSNFQLDTTIQGTNSLYPGLSVDSVNYNIQMMNGTNLILATIKPNKPIQNMKTANQKAKDSSSSDDSDSDSEDGKGIKVSLAKKTSTPMNTDTKPKTAAGFKNLPVKLTAVSKMQKDSSDDSTSESEDEPAKKSQMKVKAVPAAKNLSNQNSANVAIKPPASLGPNLKGKASSSDDSSDSDSDEKMETQPSAAALSAKSPLQAVKKATASPLKSNLKNKSSSSDDSSDSDSDNKMKTQPSAAALSAKLPLKALKKATASPLKSNLKNKSSSSDDSSDSDSGNKMEAQPSVAALSAKPPLQAVKKATASPLKSSHKNKSSSSDDSSDTDSDEVTQPGVVKPSVKTPMQSMKKPSPANSKTNSKGKTSSSDDQNANVQPSVNMSLIKTPVAASKKPSTMTPKTIPKSKSSSSDDSSDSDSDQKVKAQPGTVATSMKSVPQAIKTVSQAVKKTHDVSSSDDSDDSSDSSSDPNVKKVAPNKNASSSEKSVKQNAPTVSPKKATIPVSSLKPKNDSDSSSDSSEEDTKVQLKKPVGNTSIVNQNKLVIASKSKQKSDSSSDSSDDNEVVKKQAQNRIAVKPISAPLKNGKKDDSSSSSDSEDEKPKQSSVKGAVPKPPALHSKKESSDSSSDDENDKPIQSQIDIQSIVSKAQNIVNEIENKKKGSSSSSSSEDEKNTKQKTTTIVKKSPVKPTNIVKKQESSSSDSSDSEEDTTNVARKASLASSKPSLVQKPSAKQSSSSDSSDSEDNAKSNYVQKQLMNAKQNNKRTNVVDVNSLPNKKVAIQIKNQDSSDDSSSSEDESTIKKNVPTSVKPVASAIKKNAKDSSSSSSDSEDDQVSKNKNATTNNVPVVKGSKRKNSTSLENDEQSVTDHQSDKRLKTDWQPAATNRNQGYNNQYGNKNPVTSDSTKQRRGSSPFRRVKSENFVVDQRLKESADVAKRSLPSFQGVRGKQFRHEKTKKKRMSSFQGKVDTTVKSIRYDD